MHLWSFAHLHRVVRATAILSTLSVFAVSATSARAAGTLQINQNDGSVDTYEGVAVNVFSGSLFLTSADGKGTLVVNRAACSYQAKIIVCLPTSVILVQNGKSNALTLTTGTLYLNYTGNPQPLSSSSAKLPAHSATLSFTTGNGTYVSLRGAIDQVIKQ